MKKMSKKELVEFLIENFTDEDGDVDLSNLDFGDKNIILNELKGKIIYQSFHKATEIYQSDHKAQIIYQNWHKAEEIYQQGHEAKIIIQDNIKEKENEKNKL